MKQIILTSLTALALCTTGCTYKISKGISADGKSAEQLIFPEIEDSWWDSTFPNINNLRQINAGLNKNELYDLIGKPHFSEAQNAHEWDYVFKFRNKHTNDVEICQYKVLFDEYEIAQSFYWKPITCVNKLQEEQQKMSVAPVIMPPPKIVKEERINLSADALFMFDESNFGNMLPAGKAKLDHLANKLLELQSEDRGLRVMIAGHTDYLGDDIYNYVLSNKRAQTVRAYLIDKGVHSSSIFANGLGEVQPVKQCNSSLPRKQLINCLQPNRRVTIDISYY